MPGATGFDLLERVEVGADRIFVTAFDEYALRAFEVNALDYLPKPVAPERLARTRTTRARRPVKKNSKKRCRACRFRRPSFVV
jgi:two-component system LytT family response regulator